MKQNKTKHSTLLLFSDQQRNLSEDKSSLYIWSTALMLYTYYTYYLLIIIHQIN